MREKRRVKLARHLPITKEYEEIKMLLRTNTTLTDMVLIKATRELISELSEHFIKGIVFGYMHNDQYRTWVSGGIRAIFERVVERNTGTWFSGNKEALWCEIQCKIYDVVSSYTVNGRQTYFNRDISYRDMKIGVGQYQLKSWKTMVYYIDIYIEGEYLNGQHQSDNSAKVIKWVAGNALKLFMAFGPAKYVRIVKTIGSVYKTKKVLKDIFADEKEKAMMNKISDETLKDYLVEHIEDIVADKVKSKLF